MKPLLASLARAISRLVGVLALALVALAGLGLAVFCIQAEGTLSLPNLAEILGLPTFRDSVAGLLDRLESASPIELIPALAGLGAVLLGLLLVFGALTGGRERRFRASGSADGELSAKPKAVATAARRLVMPVSGVSEATVRPRPASRGGRLEVSLSHPRGADPKQVETAAEQALVSLRDGLGLRTRVTAQPAEKGSRVE